MLVNLTQSDAQEILESTKFPLIHHNLNQDEIAPYFDIRGTKFYQAVLEKSYSLPRMYGNPQGIETGIRFDFQDSLMLIFD